MATVNTTQLQRSLGPVSKELILAALQKLAVADHFKIDSKVRDRKRYRFLTVTPDLKPYAKSNPDSIAADKMVWSEKYLEVKAATDEFDFDPEDYREKFEDENINTTAGDIPHWQHTLFQIAETILEKIYFDILWYGDKSLTTGPKHLRIIDGFFKQIDEMRADANSLINVVSTGTLTAGSGWNSNAQSGNTEASIKKVFNGLPKAVRNKGVQAYVSDTVFQWFEEDNRRNHGESGYFQDADGNKIYYLHGTNNKCRVMKADWMPDSSRMIIVTPKENIVYQHDQGLSDTMSKMTMKGDLHDKITIGFKCVFGCGIINDRELAVNELD